MAADRSRSVTIGRLWRLKEKDLVFTWQKKGKDRHTFKRNGTATRYWAMMTQAVVKRP